MTACTNNGGSRARRAVTAALVGVLSVGAAPMVALATEAAPVAGDVQLQASADAVDAFNNGTVTIARDGNQAKLDPSNIEFEVDGANRGITVAQVKLGNDKTITNGFEVTGYYKWVDGSNGGKKDGKFETAEIDTGAVYGADDFPNEKGSYVAIVSGTGDYTTGVIYLPFTMVNKSLQGAVAYDKETDSTSLVYNGQAFSINAGKLGIMIDGDDVPASDGWTATWYNADGTLRGDDDHAPAYAGDYVLVIDGTAGGKYEGSKVSVPVKIEPLDLSKTVVTLGGANFENGAAKLPSVGAVTPELAGIAGMPSFGKQYFTVSGPAAVENGTYQYTVALADDSKLQDTGLSAEQIAGLKASIVNSAEVSVDVVDKIADDFKYDGKAFDSTLVSTIDLSAEDHFVLNEGELVVEADNETVDPEYVDVVVVNKETGENGGADMLGTPGDYWVYATVDAEACGHEFGGSSTPFSVHVKNGDIKNATMYVTYDGETKDSFLESYTGDDFLGDIDIVVKDANGNVVPSSEYEIVVTKDGKEEVDSIVDHGIYVISVESGSYDVQADTSATFKVDPVKLSPANLYLEGKFADKDFLPYTGEVLNPGYKWLVSGNATDSTAVWKTLPTDVYTVTYEQDGKQVDLKEPGTYVAKVVISDAKGNFVATAFEKNGIKVSNATVFADVPSDAWYAEEVYVANQQGYIGGMGGTNLFAPLNDLTRADFACVLYRMAGGSITASQEDLTSQNEATLSRFTDVDRTAYYAKAIAWATELGITNGYGDTFGPERTITTEEFCAMLARYAAKAGTDTSVDADAVLATVADGDEVTGYARDAVAWAVESGYVAKDGNLIDPQGTIYRGRAVKIVVDYQPEKLDEGLATDPNVDPTK